MKLTSQQTDELQRLILELLPTHPELSGFVWDDVGNRVLDHYALGNDLRDIVRLLIRAAESANPPFLEELVNAFVGKFGQEDDVTAFAAAVKPPPQRAARVIAPPYFSCFLQSRPFVDREDLRPALQYLHDHTAHPTRKPRILVVTGLANSGKSYTLHLLNHLGAQFGIKVVLIDFSRSSGEVTPVILGQRIAKRAGGTVPDLGDEQVTRWNTIFFDTFVPEVGEAEKWIVIDFGRVNISTAVEEFIDELVVQVNDSMPNVRLILLGYSKPLKTSVKRIVESDTTRDITEKELTLFFSQFYKEFGPALKKEELVQAIAGHVPDVVAKMNAAKPELRYRAMEEVLGTICDDIAKQA